MKTDYPHVRFERKSPSSWACISRYSKTDTLGVVSFSLKDAGMIFRTTRNGVMPHEISDVAKFMKELAIEITTKHTANSK